MKRIHGMAALALLPALATAACATWRGIEEPDVLVTRVDLADTGSLEQKLDVGLRIHNPNEFPLEVEGIRFDLAIDGEPVARGYDDTHFTIPAEGEREVDVRARAQTVAMLRQLMVSGGDFSYQVDGKLLLDNRQADAVAFEHSTRLDLDD
jgi:LEA14-like dessication related protein